MHSSSGWITSHKLTHRYSSAMHSLTTAHDIHSLRVQRNEREESIGLRSLAASKTIANYHPYAPSLWKKPAVGPSSAICAYFTIAMAPSAAVPGPLWLFKSVAT